MTIPEKHVSLDKPWLMPEVIEWLERRQWRTVLETGAGGSTVFFAQLGAEVVSYEHDATWAASVVANLAARGLGERVKLRCLPWYPVKGLGLSITTEFELAFIDGRGRVRSVIDVVPCLKPGGWLILDDSDRERYREAHRVMDEAAAARIVFRSGPDETTCWRKR